MTVSMEVDEQIESKGLNRGEMGPTDVFPQVPDSGNLDLPNKITTKIEPCSEETGNGGNEGELGKEVAIARTPVLGYSSTVKPQGDNGRDTGADKMNDEGGTKTGDIGVQGGKQEPVGEKPDVVDKIPVFYMDNTESTEEVENKKEKSGTSKNVEIKETKLGTSRDKEKKRKRNFESMPLEEKRKHYKCGKHFVTLDTILTWPAYSKNNTYLLSKLDCFSDAGDDELNNKVSLWQGDITCLEIDAIVNAANKSLLGGGGVDGCIHRAAGRDLLVECRTLQGCETGKAKITSGYKLPAKKVIHTVGPIGEKEDKLRSCYESCLELVKKHNLRSVAFCSISTGIYGYPIEEATHVALSTVKKWLLENKEAVDRVIFCVFLQDDLLIYSKLMMKYFPCQLGDYHNKDDEKETTVSMEVDEQTESEGLNREKRGPADVFPQVPDDDKTTSGNLDLANKITTKKEVEPCSEETGNGGGEGESGKEVARTPVLGHSSTAKPQGDNGCDTDERGTKTGDIGVQGDKQTPVGENPVVVDKVQGEPKHSLQETRV